ncbi:MAG: aspartate--tRNA ligase [Patescibacteria group bacterium]|nr:aspartate--tRNA ligase [Patescibacteria group bacterium]MCL5431475.1 aspartate--tRNA ligase [Patescibacteria group bacterium]
MERTLIADTIEKVGETVLVKGWVQTRRDHGKIVFLDVRDRWGIVQVVATDEIAGKINSEWVVEITGLVKKRPENLVNPNLATGTVEIEAKSIKVLAESETPPFPLDTEGLDIDEELRLKYRYLDLRRPRMKQNLLLRNKVVQKIRNYLLAKDFVEVETPILTKATPEGARDFLVPARLQPGNFYALPQSPQQYKQLLMVAGLERYFQIARCFRDEDPRADRAYGEFTQLDVEMSFPTQEEIRSLIENLYVEIVKEVFPDKRISKIPFPVLSYAEAIEKYGTDKPDLRADKKDKNELAFCWVIDFPLFEWKEQEKRWDAMHHPFTAPKADDIDFLYLGNPKEFGKLRADQYDFVLNGFEIGGGSIRITDPKLQSRIFEILGHSPKDIQTKFGHLLQAFKYGVPPHGGIAPGIDRFIMAALSEPTLREVIAFPTSASGRTAVMDAPSIVDKSQLDELGISIKSKRPS